VILPIAAFPTFRPMQRRAREGLWHGRAISIAQHPINPVLFNIRTISLSMRMKAFLAAVAALSGLSVLTGCPPKSGTDDRRVVIQSGEGAEEAVWPFWPTQMQIHLSTRMIPAEGGGQPIIESRIRFFDSEGAISKAVGQLTLQLHDAAAGADHEKPLQVWNQDLRNLALNRRQYDDVLQAYLFRLEVDPASLPAGPELRAFFLSNDSQRLTDRFTLRR
jgi:hypothetical protein